MLKLGAVNINFRRTFFRCVGYVFCAIMLILCVILIIAAAGFGSREVVNVFGYNIYIVQAEGFDKAPKGSAVIVKKASAFGIESGKLILYEKGGEGEQYALGYVREPHVDDGVYYLTVTDNVSTLEVPEVRLVGVADYSSVFVGSVIGFIKTPFGIFCIAVMPCLALILYDIIRAAASRLPEPEVEPQIKNYREEVVSQKNISVKGDGKAAYSKANGGGSAAEADDVLFNYSPKKQSARQGERPIIPLTDRGSDHSDSSRGNAKSTDVSRTGMPRTSNTDDSRETAKKRINPGALPSDIPKTPDTVGMSRYISNSQGSGLASDKTAELPDIRKSRDLGDAFFAQTTSTSAVIPKDGVSSANAAGPAGSLKKPGTSRTSGFVGGEDDDLPRASAGTSRGAPQIGRQAPKRADRDADDERDDVIAPHRVSGRRSAQILASKRVEDLISDDDDFRGKNRSNDSVVDDIISGINNHDNS